MIGRKTVGKEKLFKIAAIGTWHLLLLIAGVFAFTVAVKSLYIPNNLLSGGVTGIALLAEQLLGWKVGLVTLILNIPIFLLGYRDVGKKFFFMSGMGVLIFWIAVDHVPIQPLTKDPLLAAVFAGVIGGIGSALAIRAGGSLGGFDILGVVLNRRFSLGIGEASMILNGLLIVAAGIIQNAELAMYTLIAIFVGGRTLDSIQKARPRKAIMIFSPHNATIKSRILSEMARGVSIFKSEGAFSGLPNDVLMCVITRFEMKELRDIIKAEDPNAFVTVFEASEVIGRFHPPTAFTKWKQKASLKNSKK